MGLVAVGGAAGLDVVGGSAFPTKMNDIRLIEGDCLEVMGEIPDGSIDLVLCDLPYGITACKWDIVIPFEPLWDHYRRLLKSRGAVVLMASQPFTSMLIMSNREWFKYCWYWHKNMTSGFQLAKKQPLRVVEDICVFYSKQPTYNPQPTKSIVSDRIMRPGSRNGGFWNQKENHHRLGTKQLQRIVRDDVSPRNCLEIPCVPRATGTLHSTQKPVALMEYLIRTYSNEGDTILDNAMGSGTTGVACLNTGRNFLGIEKAPEIFAVAERRIAAHRASTPLLA
jgi:site-specific DNA-methyltransferase (adenine-specific)